MWEWRIGLHYVSSKPCIRVKVWAAIAAWEVAITEQQLFRVWKRRKINMPLRLIAVICESYIALFARVLLASHSVPVTASAQRRVQKFFYIFFTNIVGDFLFYEQ